MSSRNRFPAMSPSSSFILREKTGDASAREPPASLFSPYVLYLGTAASLAMIVLVWGWESFVDNFAWFETARIQVLPVHRATWLFPLPPLGVADLFGSAVVCFNYRASAEFPKHWLETLVVCTILQFGGTTLTGILLGQSPSWLTSPAAWPSLALMWWLTFFCPFDAWYCLLCNRGEGNPIRMGLLFGAWFSSGHAVTSWGMDKALLADHARANTSILTALVTGTLSACGGGIIAADMFGLEWSFRKPRFLQQPTMAMQKGAACSVFYYLLRDPHSVLRTTMVGGVLRRGIAAFIEAETSAGRLDADGTSMESHVAAHARASTGVFMFLLSLHAHLFPNTSIVEIGGSVIARLLNIDPMVNPSSRGKHKDARTAATKKVY